MYAKRLALEGKFFSQDRAIRFNVITTRKVVNYLRSGGRHKQEQLLKRLEYGKEHNSQIDDTHYKFDSVKIGMSDICGLYKDKQRIVILY